VNAVIKSLKSPDLNFLECIATVGDLLFEPETRPLVFRTEAFKLFLSKLSSASTDELAASLWKFEGLSQLDEIRKEFSIFKGYSEIVQTLLSHDAPSHRWVHLSIPAWKLFTKGDDIRESIARDIPLVIDNLASLIEKINKTDAHMFLSGMILMLIGYFPDKTKVLELAKDILFTVAKNSEQNHHRNVAIDCLIEAAAIDRSRPILLSIGAKELVQPYVKEPSSEAGFLSCLLLALLAASDESDSNELGGEPTPTGAIDQALGLLDSFASRSVIEVNITKKLVIFCDTVLIAIRSLATNEANLKALKERNIVSKMLNFFKNRKDLSVSNQRYLEEVFL